MIELSKFYFNHRIPIMTSLKDYTQSLAEKSGVSLASIKITEGKDVGCLDTHLLALSTIDNKHDFILVYQSDIETIDSGKHCKRLERKFRNSFNKLKHH
jgi:DNA gyrase/topoisomerase IV subunit B